MRIKINWWLILLCLVLIGGTVSSKTLVETFVDYQTAQADVIWSYSNPSGEQIVSGVFTVSLPEHYSLVVTDAYTPWQKINGYRNLIAVYTATGRVEYKYESIQLFNVYKSLFGYLMDVAQHLTIYLGDEMVGGRSVARYECEDGNTYWLERETRIPLRITDAAGRNILSLKQYQVDADHKQGVELFTLTIKQDGWEGQVRLNKSNGHWFPTELQISDNQSLISLTFSNWRIMNQQLVFRDLMQLEYLLTVGAEASRKGEHEQVINYYRQLLNIDPFYVQGYKQLARSYTLLGNYLGAIENYQQWLMLEPDNAAAMNNLAYTYMLEGINLSEAIDLAYRAVSLDPKPAYLDTLGYGYFLIGDYQKALYYLHQADKVGSPSELWDIYDHLHQVYAALGDYANAEYYLQLQKSLDMVDGEET